MQPHPKDGLATALATLQCYPTTLNLRMPSVAKVSLADCFALWGKCTKGLKTPGYSKTVLRTETQRLRRILLSINVCSSACNRAWACLHFSTTYSSIVQRIIWLQAWSTKLPPQPTHLHMPTYVFTANRSPVRRTVSQ